MKSLNRVWLMGHLGAAPEIMSSKSGRPYSRLRLATKRRWRGADKWEEETDWHTIFVFGRTAEVCVQYLNKGSFIWVEGTMVYWSEQENGQSRHQQAVQAIDVKFLSGKARPEMAAENGSETPTAAEILDNLETPRNHNAVAQY